MSPKEKEYKVGRAVKGTQIKYVWDREENELYIVEPTESAGKKKKRKGTPLAKMPPQQRFAVLLKMGFEPSTAGAILRGDLTHIYGEPDAKQVFSKAPGGFDIFERRKETSYHSLVGGADKDSPGRTITIGNLSEDRAKID